MINKKEFYDICPVLQGPEGVSTHNINLERKFYNQKWYRKKKKGLPSSSLVPIVFFSFFIAYFLDLIIYRDLTSRISNAELKNEKWSFVSCLKTTFALDLWSPLALGSEFLRMGNSLSSPGNPRIFLDIICLQPHSYSIKSRPVPDLQGKIEFDFFSHYRFCCFGSRMGQSVLTNPQTKEGKSSLFPCILGR